MRNVEEALLLGALLTVLVVFLFLNSWRSTVITGVALPISVLASFIAVWALGFKLETMSLLGLSLAIGILIDDAIVVRENIVRHVEMGKDHYTAAREGTDEIGLAVAATTFSILAVFVPIGFMPGVGGQWFKPFALTIACVGARVALRVLLARPDALGVLARSAQGGAREGRGSRSSSTRSTAGSTARRRTTASVIAWALDHRAAMITIAIGTFFASFLAPDARAERARRRARRHRRHRVRLQRDAVSAAGAEAAIVARRSRGVRRAAHVSFRRSAPSASAFFPEDDRSEFIIKIETPPGSNLEYTRLKAQEAGTHRPRAARSGLHLHDARRRSRTGAVDVGNIYVKLRSKADRKSDGQRSVAQLARDLRLKMKQGRGRDASPSSTNDFSGGFKQILIQIRGQDAQVLSQFAEQVRAEVAEDSRARWTSGSRPRGRSRSSNVDAQPRRRRLARRHGGAGGAVAASGVRGHRRRGLDGSDGQGARRHGAAHAGVAAARRRSASSCRSSCWAPTARRRRCRSARSRRSREGFGPAIIDHLNREPVVNVELNTSGRATGDVTADIVKMIERTQLPPGVPITLGGDAEAQAEVFGQIFAALGLAVLLMYLILVVQFGSFLDPLAIMMSLPLSLIGVMLSLAITGNTINIMSLIGVILLMGIVAKNAILLIDFAKWAREERGMPLREALIEAGAIRLRPILMTTFALIAGMMPDRARDGRRRAVPRAARRRDHRWRDHVDVPDAARDPDVLRSHGRASLEVRASCRHARVADGGARGAGGGGRRLVSRVQSKPGLPKKAENCR